LTRIKPQVPARKAAWLSPNEPGYGGNRPRACRTPPLSDEAVSRKSFYDTRG
jgi:hypothetical protein